MTTHPNIGKGKAGFTALLVLTLLSGMATPAAATSYTMIIEDPTRQWNITGSFESDLTVWTVPGDISKWSFSADFSPPTPILVGPISQSADPFNPELLEFSGSVATGVDRLLVIDTENTVNKARINYFEFFDGQNLIYTIQLFNDDGSPNRFVITSGKLSAINSEVSAVPEPTTALLLMTGLAGLAGFRWQQLRRKTN